MTAVPLWLPPDAKLMYTLELPEATPSNNIIKGMHFFVYKKTRSMWKARVLQTLTDQGIALDSIEPIKKSFLSIYRFSAGNGLDWDNAYGGLKPVLDCLVVGTDKNPDGLGLIFDDNPKSMPYPPFVQQFSSKRNNASSIIQIYSLT